MSDESPDDQRKRMLAMATATMDAVLATIDNAERKLWEKIRALEQVVRKVDDGLSRRVRDLEAEGERIRELEESLAQLQVPPAQPIPHPNEFLWTLCPGMSASANLSDTLRSIASCLLAIGRDTPWPLNDRMVYARWLAKQMIYLAERKDKHEAEKR